MSEIRPAAVAGSFYPAEPERLAATVDRLLAEARARTPDDVPAPDALIAPHAGYVYSGPIAASAYARLRPGQRFKRVVVAGPTHRKAVRGIAVPTAGALATPLGEVPVDRDAIAGAADALVMDDEAHALEHAIEVHLPFLQRTLGNVPVVPLAVGDASGADVEALLERLWDDETLVIISSDLSHYHDDATAQARDAATAMRIETLNDDVGPHDACGARPVAGLLRVARRRDLRASTIDLRNSAATAGPPDRVVGYGAWALAANDADTLSGRDRRMLLATAARSIRHGLTHGKRPEVAVTSFVRELRNRRASFVTLKLDGDLRGCIGSLGPRMTLAEDVAHNAWSAAFEDPRFAPLTRDDFDRLSIEVSVLGVAADMDVTGEADLLAKLRPGRDGLILADGDRRGLFLPQVWKSLPTPADFVGHLKRKAGLAPDHWSETTTARRFSTESFGAPVRELL